MTNVANFELLLVLMAAVIALELVAVWLRLPPAAALILGGIGLAMVPGTPDVELDPDLVLILFLPPLLLASAYLTSWRDFRANLRTILQLAVGAVVFTTLVVGVVAHWVVPALPWAACFALGAIVSPPDAVAAKAVLERLPLPRRVRLLLEGESLVNDATGLVLFRFAVAAALTGGFDAAHAATSFGILAIVGVAAGVACGFVASTLVSCLKEAHLAIIGSFLAAWVSYVGAEALGGSGVLSTVACGLVIGWRQHEHLSATVRMQLMAVWRFVVFILESMVFILIGLSLRGVLGRLGGTWQAVHALMLPAAAVVAAVILARFVWIFAAVYLPRAAIPALRRRDPYPPVAVPLVMGWAGMRGVVSLAAALSLPDAFPGRDFILATTFAVILVTVLLQGTTLAPLIRKLRLTSAPETQGLSEAAARARMAEAQLAAVTERSLMADGSHRHPRLVEQYGHRVTIATRFSKAEIELTPHRTEHFSAILGAIAAGRAAVLRMHRAHEIDDVVLHLLEEQLDLEEVGALQVVSKR